MDTGELPSDKRPSRSVASLLKLERIQHGWTQVELAKHIGTTQVNVSRWEKGSTIPGPFYRRKLGNLFGKTLEELGFVQETEDHGLGNISNDRAPLAHSAHLAFWNVPYRRNPFFTGREEVLSQLHETLHNRKTAALTQAQAISGLGGIGKTQIAVEYAYRYRDSYQAILWVTAFTRDTLLTDYINLAFLLDLGQDQESDQEIIVSAVKHWLSTNENWLLILDNVDDLQVVVDFLPSQGSGNILLTTRLRALGSIAHSIEVEKMDVEEGVMFLLRRAGSLTTNVPHDDMMGESRALVVEVVTALDGLPLALDQAGAYIEETCCGFSGYLDLYRTRREELLMLRGRIPTDHPEPVTATWSLSFQQVEQESSAAADLLRLFAFLGPDAIPEEIIANGTVGLGPPLGSLSIDPLKINSAIEILLRYSLVRRNPEAKFIIIHRLVQAVLKDSMERSAQQLWAERAVRAVNATFPNVELETWPACQRCLPHAQLCALHIEEYKLNFPEAARLLNQAANFLSTHAQYGQAEMLLKQALLEEYIMIHAKPERNREILKLVIREGHSHEETAKILGVPAPVVGYIVRSAKRYVRSRIEQDRFHKPE